MKIIRFSLADVSSSFPSIIPAGIPGIIEAILDNDPLHRQLDAFPTQTRGKWNSHSHDVGQLLSPVPNTELPSLKVLGEILLPIGVGHRHILPAKRQILARDLIRPLSAYICSTRPCMSPIPSSFEMKGCGAKRSRSFRCSPVPRKMMGVLVAATLEGQLPASKQVSFGHASSR
jgi:hypothetical protein